MPRVGEGVEVKKIVWVANPMEAEIDLWRAGKNHPDLDLQVWINTGPPLAEYPYFTGGPSEDSLEGRRELLARVAAIPADLYVFRYPTWVLDGLGEEFQRLFADLPVVAWMSEQGPTLGAALHTIGPFTRVAVNNRHEMPAYRSFAPHVQLYYLPFGCAEWAPEECLPQELFRSRVIADGGCHYLCGEYGGWKRRSVDVMVLPIMDLGLGLWGHGPADHGWLGVPGVVGDPLLNPNGLYRGAYVPVQTGQVYASCEVYVGINWGWGLGGYGTKLARALAAGIPVVWHRTVGMELDGLIPGRQLLTSGTPEETRCAVQWLLGDEEKRRELGAAGRAFALAKWEWGANLKRLAQEVAQDG